VASPLGVQLRSGPGFQSVMRLSSPGDIDSWRIITNTLAIMHCECQRDLPINVRGESVEGDWVCPLGSTRFMALPG